MRFLIGDTAHNCETGSFVFVPRGVPHAFANPEPGPARILIIAVYGRYNSELRSA
jgi:quercetin dioxygenase-like cupin family protein